jgi:hypothetical protein
LSWLSLNSKKRERIYIYIYVNAPPTPSASATRQAGRGIRISCPLDQVYLAMDSASEDIF